MGGICFPSGKAHQPHHYAHGLPVGRAFSVPRGGPEPSNLPQTLGRRLSPRAGLRHPTPRSGLGYLKKTAANVAYDYFRHVNTQSFGGDKPHDSTSDVDPEAGKEVRGSQETIVFEILLKEIDEHLKHCLTGPDQERDRTIFLLYFRQGMSTKEIASLPTIGLGPKGVGSVIERLKHDVREQIVRPRSVCDDVRGPGVGQKANSRRNS